MKLRIGQCITEYSIEVHDLQEFMRQHYPRKHGWPDAQEAWEYLKTQRNGEYLSQLIQEIGMSHGKSHYEDILEVEE